MKTTMRAPLALAAILVLVVAAPAAASFVLDAGYGVAKAPANDGEVGMLAPDGETKGSFVAEWIGNAGPDPIVNAGKPYGPWWSFGASFFLYEVDKAFSDTGNVEINWQVIHLNFFVERTIPLGKKFTAPQLSLRGGVTILPTQVTATRSSPTFYDTATETETKIGPYLGVALRVPVPDTHFGVWGVVSKTFAKSSHLRAGDAEVGALFAGLGLSRTFR